jgi:hypothetical protein
MQTDRLRFQYIDQSFTVGTPTAITGATVIRASKGTNFPQLVNKGDTQTFLNLFGAPSSQYPGVQEALDFLQNYSLWVSAPGGTISSLSLTSYYGGIYLTTLGSMEAFYGVTEGNAGIPSINFLTSVQTGDGSPLSGPSTMSYNAGTYTLSISNIPAAFFSASSISSIILTFKRSDGTIATIPFTVSGTSLLCTNPSTGLTLTATNAVSSTGISIIGATGGFFDNYSITTSTGTYADLSFQTNTTYLTSLWGTIVPSGTLMWIYNIQQYVIMALYQTSPRTTIGSITMGTTYPVDTRTTVATQYSSVFTFSGSTSLTNGTVYPLYICGNAYSLTPKVGGTGSSIPITSTVTLIQAIMNSLTNASVPGGYAVTNTSSTITITYSGNTLAPSIVLGSLLTTASYAVNFVTQYTVGGPGSETNGTYILNGTQFTLGATLVSNTSTLATAITSACLGNTGSYVVSNLGAIISITYPITLPAPTLSFNSSMGGFTATLTSIPTAATAGATITTNPYYNTFTFNYTELAYTGYNYTHGGKAYTLSPSPTAVDSSGNSTYAGTVLEGDNFLGAICYQNFTNTLSGYTWNPSAQNLQGTRAASSIYLNPTLSSYQSSYLSTVLAAGWNMMTLPALDNVNIFFDPECDLATASTMASMRTGSISDPSFATYITGIKVSDGVAIGNSDVNNVVNDLIMARASYPNLSGLAYYCNEFQQTETYNGTTYYNIPIGAVASMLALIMDVKLGGAAPMYTNEGQPALGGQINKAVSNQKYNFQAQHFSTLSAAGLNPIILDPYYQLMITSQLTAQSPANLTDWSYLGHQMSFDLFMAEIRQNVMIPQIGKLIDPTHMQLRTDQANIILNKRLSGPTTIWSAGEVYISEVNTPATMAQNNFMMKIRVKVYPFSEYVTLIFNNVGQTSSVTTA